MGIADLGDTYEKMISLETVCVCSRMYGAHSRIFVLWECGGYAAEAVKVCNLCIRCLGDEFLEFRK